jgi:hypothetical protein
MVGAARFEARIKELIQNVPDLAVLVEFACARLSQPCLPGSRPTFSATFTTVAFDDSSLRWPEINT